MSNKNKSLITFSYALNYDFKYKLIFNNSFRFLIMCFGIIWPGEARRKTDCCPVQHFWLTCGYYPEQISAVLLPWWKQLQIRILTLIKGKITGSGPAPYFFGVSPRCYPQENKRKPRLLLSFNQIQSLIGLEIFLIFLKASTFAVGYPEPA